MFFEDLLSFKNEIDNSSEVFLKKLLSFFLLALSINAFSQVKDLTQTSSLQVLMVHLEAHYGVICEELSEQKIFCASMIDDSGFSISQKATKKKLELTISPEGSVKAAFNNVDSELIGADAITMLKEITEASILKNGKCKKFKSGFSLVGVSSRGKMHTTCADQNGNKAKINVEYRDQLNFVNLEKGWQSKGTYINKISISI